MKLACIIIKKDLRKKVLYKSANKALLSCGSVGVLTSICFNITIVLCSTLSLFQRSCRMERASDISLLSGQWAWSLGPALWSQHPASPATFSAMIPFHRSRHSMSKWERSTTAEKDLSALLQQCSPQRKVELDLCTSTLTITNTCALNNFILNHIFTDFKW